ncbi:hypothetical protein D0868_14324 [Hortaea werneckii]|uniref:Uncharacterized protein n=1 Tax=Hortaea werneckii TaxID=91943 RepID=A0A3M6XK97_HORWE|nr:hypothetical protein D0868_14324 [Hortaea werneckii]
MRRLPFPWMTLSLIPRPNDHPTKESDILNVQTYYRTFCFHSKCRRHTWDTMNETCRSERSS